MSTIDQCITSSSSLLSEPGSAFEFGCYEIHSEKYTKLAKEKYPNKPYCLVRDWVVWDIRTNQAEAKLFEANSIKPIVVHAKFVIDDQTGRVPIGDYRISTPLVEMFDPCFFVTRNTVYILTGSGTRKSVDAKDVVAFWQIVQ